MSLKPFILNWSISGRPTPKIKPKKILGFKDINNNNNNLIQKDLKDTYYIY